MSLILPRDQAPKPEQKPYQPFGKARDFLLARDPEVLFAGPAGTGKTRAGCEKIHFLADNRPGVRILLARKTRKSLTSTALVTLEEHVMPAGHPAKRGARREQRSSYHYPNGSEIVVGGLDDPEKIMSSEFDVVYIPEATECLEEDVEMLTTRLRNGKLSYQQLMMDCNPSTPHHWLRKRCDTGKTRLIESGHEDNPRLFDHRRGAWTEEGLRYLAVLDNLSGARRDRLRHGKWVAPEGARFPHAMKSVQGFHASRLWPQGIPEAFTKWISVDFGLAAPYAALWHCMDHAGNVYTYREDYGPGYTADVQAKRIRELSPANERYIREYMDPAMWNKRAYAKEAELTDAEMYIDEWRSDPRFGPVEKGFNRSRSTGFGTLDRLLNRGNGYHDWFIEFECQDLWRELEDAVFHKSPTTGVFSEDLDETCGDHALTAAYYGLHTYLEGPKDMGPDEEIDMDRVYRARQEEQLRNARKQFDGNRARRLRI